MSRLKRLGERLAARDPARQVAEVQIRCGILNTFNRFGMPDAVAAYLIEATRGISASSS